MTTKTIQLLHSFLLIRSVRNTFRRSLFVLLFAVVTGCAYPAFAQISGKRIALLIGNDNYKGTRVSDDTNWARLDNAAKDARDIGARLKELGFSEVEIFQNLSRQEIYEALSRLGKRVAEADQVVFYFSGHGVQSDTRNYLIPVDSGPSLNEAALKADAIPLDEVIQSVSKGAGTKIVILDVCRTLPRGFRGQAEIGMASPEARRKLPPQTLVIFSAQANEVASDGLGQANGYFAQGLRKGLLNVDANLFNVMVDAEEEVLRLSNQRQRPVIYGSPLAQKHFRFSTPEVVKLTPTTRLEQENSAQYGTGYSTVIGYSRDNGYTEIAGYRQLPETTRSDGSTYTIVQSGASLETKNPPSGVSPSPPSTGKTSCQVLTESGQVLADFLVANKNPKGIVVTSASQCLVERDAYVEANRLKVTGREVLPPKSPSTGDPMPISERTQPSSFLVFFYGTATDSAPQPCIVSVDLGPPKYCSGVTIVPLEPGENQESWIARVSRDSSGYGAVKGSTYTSTPTSSLAQTAGEFRNGWTDQSNLSYKVGRYSNGNVEDLQHRLLRGNCTNCPEMMVIPAGSFVMGFTEGYDQEKPGHLVTVRSFALGRTEITQGLWRTVMDHNPSYFRNCGVNCPVEVVSWDDIQEFIKRLNAQTSNNYRLPSEAEWEYATRAASPDNLGIGSDESLVGKNAWYMTNSGRTTHQVARKLPNEFGLFDMHGNVSEWVQDCWHDNYNGAPTDGTAWSTNCHENSRVLRGGSWRSDSTVLRSASRRKAPPNVQDFSYGFRLALTLPPH